MKLFLPLLFTCTSLFAQIELTKDQHIDDNFYFETRTSGKVKITIDTKENQRFVGGLDINTRGSLDDPFAPKEPIKTTKKFDPLDPKNMSGFVPGGIGEVDSRVNDQFSPQGVGQYPLFQIRRNENPIDVTEENRELEERTHDTYQLISTPGRAPVVNSILESGIIHTDSEISQIETFASNPLVGQTSEKGTVVINGRMIEYIYKTNSLDGIENQIYNFTPSVIEDILADERLPYQNEQIHLKCEKMLMLTLANEDLLTPSLSLEDGSTSFNKEETPNLFLIQETLREVNRTNIAEGREHVFPGISNLLDNRFERDFFQATCAQIVYDGLANNQTEDISLQTDNVEMDEILQNGVRGLVRSGSLHENQTGNVANDNCKNHNECLWKNNQHLLRSCEIFKCTVGGEQFGQTKSFQDIGTKLILQANTFEMKGDESFCNNCFIEAAENKTEFRQKKEDLENKIEEKIAARIAKKEFYKLADTYETLVDASIESEEDFKLNLCESNLNSLQNYPCGGETTEVVNAQTYNKRLQKTMEHLGFNQSVNMKEVTQLFKDKTMKEGSNQCDRRDYALHKKNTWMSDQNKSVRDAFNLIVDDFLDDEIAKKVITDNCTKENDPNDTFSEYEMFLSSVMGAKLVRDIMDDQELLSVMNSVNTNDEKIDILCAYSKNQNLKGLHCHEEYGSSFDQYNYFESKLGKDQLGDSKLLFNFADSLQEKQSGVYSPAFGTLRGISSLYAVSDNIGGLTTTVYNNYSHVFKNLLDVSKIYHPYIKANLSNKNAFCKAFMKSKESGIKLSEALREKDQESLKTLNESLCKNVADEIKDQLCEKISFADYAPKDYQDALKEMRNEVEETTDNNLVLNSLACSNNREVARQLTIANPQESTTQLDSPGSLSGSDAERFDANPSFYANPASPAYARTKDFNTFIQNPLRVCNNDWKNAIQYQVNTSSDQNIYEADGDKDRIEHIIAHENAVNSFSNNQNIIVNNDIRNNILPNLDIIAEQTGNDNIPSMNDVLNSSDPVISNLSKESRERVKSNRSNANKIVNKLKQEAIVKNNSIAQRTNQQMQDLERLYKENPNEYAQKSLTSDVANSYAQELNEKKNQALASDQVNPGSSTKTTQLSALSGSLNGAASSDGAMADRQIASTNAADACDEACLARLREKIINKGSNSTPQGNSSEAITAGLNPQGLSDSVLEEFTNVMRGSDNSEELQEIQNSYQSLLEKTEDIERQFVEAPKSVQEENVPLSFNNDFVFDARNTTEPKFYPREEIAAKAADFAPSYVAQETPKKMSFLDYQSERRKSNNSFGNVQKEINTQIDSAFLSSQSFEVVDDLYIDAYIDHVDKSNGSIDHLVIFEDGEPTKIRVPDPKNAGLYILKNIPQSLKEKVLGQVQKDEVNSFTLYSMISFEQSLNDFITTVEAENENIVSLGGLNQILDRLEQQAQ